MSVFYTLLIIFLLILAFWLTSGLLGLLIISKRISGRYLDVLKEAYDEGEILEFFGYTLYGPVIFRFSLKPNLKDIVNRINF